MQKRGGGLVEVPKQEYDLPKINSRLSILRSSTLGPLPAISEADLEGFPRVPSFQLRDFLDRIREDWFLY